MSQHVPEPWVVPLPEQHEVFLIARAIVTAVSGEHGLTDLQYHVLAAQFVEMTGVHVNPDFIDPLSPAEFAAEMTHRGPDFRVRVVQSMLLAAFILDPLPQATVERIGEYARALDVDESMITVAQHQAQGARDLIKVDFSRAGYHRDHTMPSGLPEFSVARPDHWEAVEDDPVLAGRWESLADLPESTLGHHVWQFYRSRGFSFPGSPGSAAPFLAQHDWVHVIADYGSTVESEIEVFGLISRADANPEAFALLAMVLSLFETGSLASVSIFRQDPRYMTRNARRMGERLADAMYRGAVVARNFRGEDLMAVDWFALADRDVVDVRQLIGIPPKSTAALRAGSVGPWEPGGISDFQVGLGRQAALARGEDYDPHGASVLPPEIEG